MSVRLRRTRAEMEEMTIQEEREEQNSINAKNCVARKNEEKQKLTAELPELEAKLEQLREKNQKQKDELIPRLAEREEGKFGPDDGNVLELKNKMDEAHGKYERYEDILNQGRTGVNQNTYASRKSRAKGSYDLATAKYHNAKHRLDIAIEQAYWNELAAAATVLNPYFREQGRPVFPENTVDVEFDQYQPS